MKKEKDLMITSFRITEKLNKKFGKRAIDEGLSKNCIIVELIKKYLGEK